MKEMVKLLPYIKQYKGMFAGGILLMICMVGFELAGPLIAAAILDTYKTRRRQHCHTADIIFNCTVFNDKTAACGYELLRSNRLSFSRYKSNSKDAARCL